MINKPLSEILLQIGDLLELGEENSFRIRAIRRGAEIIGSYSDDLALLDRKKLLGIPGIGNGLADIIEEYAKTKKVSELEKLKKKFPDGVRDMMNVQGLGAKRAALLYKKLRLDNLDKLAKAAKGNKLTSLEGFGPKLQESIIKNVAFSQEASKRFLLSDGRDVSQKLLLYLSRSSLIQKPQVAGSLRRWKETVGDLDFLCISDNPNKAINYFQAYPEISRVLAFGKTKCSVVLNSGMQCDFRVVDKKSYGATLMYFTGSKEHNVRLRELAQKKGLTLNEYGLFKKSDKKQLKPVASATEKEIYQKLGLKWIPPELREDRGEIEAARKNDLPNLVEDKDVCGDFHNHTFMSDGADSLKDMVLAAKSKNWKWFYSADHSPSLTVANGLNVQRLTKKMREVKSINNSQHQIYIGCSSEVDILAQGELDYPDSTLAKLDCVVASVHSRFKQPENEMTKRICTAISNPHVDILGHLSGRLLNRRESYAVDVEQVLSVAASTGTALEINGQSERQELQDIYVSKAIKMKIPLAVSTDAHSTKQLDNMTFAVHIARRGWAEKKDIVNCLSTKEIQKWLKR